MLELIRRVTRPLERALREAQIPFYSIDPYRITRYRQAVLGQHKNNKKDAVAVAYSAREQAAQGNLEVHRRTWFPDETLRPLVRLYEQKQKEATREINRLWQRIQNVSGDMFLTLRRSFTRDGIAKVIDEHRTRIIDKIMELKDVEVDVPPYSAAAQVELSSETRSCSTTGSRIRFLPRHATTRCITRTLI